MKHSTSKSRNNRRGIIAVLSAVLFIVMLAMVAFAVDVGYVGMVRTQLQAAADSAALAAAGDSNNVLGNSGMVQTAQKFAQYHTVAGRPVVLNTGDVQFGVWDVNSRTFTAMTGGQLGTAVKVTVYADASHGGNAGLFFARVLGVSSAAEQASAVAMVNPRDICFVVDLSSSMHIDTTPNNQTTTHDNLIQAVYDDLFGANHVTYSPSEKSTSLSSTVKTAMNTIKNNYPYIIPTPNTSDSTSVQYWTDCLSSANLNNQISYKSYANLLMTHGRDQPLVDGTTRYSIMSTNNPNCRRHSETVGTSTLAHTFTNFPTPEMPTHALRRAVIAGLEIIQDRNSPITDASQMDQVSIVAFDRVGNFPTPVKTLTTNYADVMQAAAGLQACGGTASGTQNCTDSEGGLMRAVTELNSTRGRANANKVVTFLTDGNANLYESPNGTIDQYMQQHSGGWDNDYPSNAALMQAAMMQGNNWYLYSVGIGSDADQGFMNRMAVKGGTDVNGATFTDTTSSATCEATLTSIFQSIIANPRLRLVQ